MKLFVVVGVLVGFISAAIHLTEEESKLQQAKSFEPKATGSSGPFTDLNGSATASFDNQSLSEILSKLLAGLGQGVAQHENFDPQDPLKSQLDIDFMESNGLGILSKVDPKLKEALG